MNSLDAVNCSTITRDVECIFFDATSTQNVTKFAAGTSLQEIWKTLAQQIPETSQDSVLMVYDQSVNAFRLVVNAEQLCAALTVRLRWFKAGVSYAKLVAMNTR